MAGVGKLLKQAQKMQRSIETLQAQLEAKEIDVTSGGGAVKIKINGSGKILSLNLYPEFLKEDPKLISDTLSRGDPGCHEAGQGFQRCRNAKSDVGIPNAGADIRRIFDLIWKVENQEQRRLGTPCRITILSSDNLSSS